MTDDLSLAWLEATTALYCRMLAAYMGGLLILAGAL